MDGSFQRRKLIQSVFLRNIQAGLQLFIGIGAVGGGFVLIMDPTGGTIGMPISFLAGSPFPNYLIPGLFLLIINGFGTLAGSVSTLKNFRYAGEIAIVFGIILMAWIVIQLIIIKSFSFFHPMYFAAGLIEAFGGFMLRRRLINKFGIEK